MPPDLAHFFSNLDMRLVTIPVISAFIGYITNVLAVKMIFHPRRRIGPRWLGLHGLVPKRQNELATAVGHTVQKHLVSQADVQAILARPEVQGEMDELVRERIARFLEEKLKAMGPMVRMFLTSSMKQKLEDALMEEVRALTPAISEKLMARVENEMDFQAIVEERVRAFDLGQLEAIIYEISGRELKAIEWLGGVLGLLIGLVQIAILRL